MATFLFRLGRFCYRHRWQVTSVWALVLVLTGVGAATLSGTMSNTFSVPGTESQQAINQLAERFPQAHVGGATARVVFVAPSGTKLAQTVNKTAVEQVVAKMTTAPEVGSVTDPFKSGAISADGRYAIANVTYKVQGTELTDADREALAQTFETGRAAGLTVEASGDALPASEAAGASEGIGVLIAAVVLVITFGSLIAAGLPLLTAIVGVGVGIAGVTTLSGFVDINANSLILALMLGLAVGIDYALFIVSRFRHELQAGSDGRTAAGRAVGTAGSAVVFAGLTVIIALAGLSVVGIPVLASMGLAAAGTVAVAVLIAITLIPALLGFTGRRLARGGRRTSEKGSMGERWAKFVTRRRVPVLIVALLGLGAIALPATQLRLGLPDDGMASTTTTQRKAYDLISKGFGPGLNGPLTVVVSGSNRTETTAAATHTAATIKALPDVTAVTPAVLSPDGTTALLNVIPSSAPTDQKTTDLVKVIRAHKQTLYDETGARVSVTGQTAVNIDVSDTIGGALLPYLAIIVGLAIVLLMIVFRSVLVPLKATLGFLLSTAATFGAVVAVFQWGWLSNLLGVSETGPIMSLLPVLLVGILFGLAMDYQVFLVTRMREDYTHGAGAQEAVVTGVRHGARVVSAAAVIMISVFGGFILSDDVLVKSIGFALAFGVLIDAFVIRMTIVPAVMSLLGNAAWWLPRWLGRILPRVDVEGEALGETTPAADRTPEPVH
ncbi:RND superfamily putative drug exporter [Kribbella antiqua]|uniref:RND superfamily putative drug exporter n=1 Tax=Kribbella antiqua TaxID=2512217 RepID=A0A4R2J5K3_9ACTN|nr:MMPL family transporter [Kribbella antiqua]TCO51519.1 RND superfamily putative drug exporter [Kribbella antiqua]